MEQFRSPSGRLTFRAEHHFAGQAQDYTTPADAITWALWTMMREFEANGGDLNAFQLSSALEKTSARMGREHLVVRLHGYGLEP